MAAMIDSSSPRDPVCVLAVNAGSSSLRFALYDVIRPLLRRLRGKIERIGFADTTLTVDSSTGAPAKSRAIEARDHGGAASALIDWLEEAGLLAAVNAVGHRVVHGGSRYSTPARIDDELLQTLRGISADSPEHLPGEIDLIMRFSRRLPNVPQVACFDTAFHHDMPRVAQLLPIPRRFNDKGVRRFGFHGLSYAFLMEELERAAGTDASLGRVILAHLGNGSSLVAVRQGQSVDTTMAFTPAAGVPMSTRSGDLDPGLAWYFARSENMSAEQFHHMVNHESGLLGISETSSDMRELLAREEADVRAAEAVALYCYQIRKSIGAFAAALGGLDTLVFTGGVGERSAPVRAAAAAGLRFLGVTLDQARNDAAAGDADIGAAGAAVRALVVEAREDLEIARQVRAVLAA